MLSTASGRAAPSPALAVAAVLLLPILASCGGSSGRGTVVGPGERFVNEGWILTLRDNAGVIGLQVDLALADGVTVAEATALGPLAGALCAENPEEALFACTDLPDFAVPAAVYQVTLRRDVTVRRLDAVLDVSCVGADVDAEQRFLDCSLDFE